jgi:hypothetical protein
MLNHRQVIPLDSPFHNVMLQTEWLHLLTAYIASHPPQQAKHWSAEVHGK